MLRTSSGTPCAICCEVGICSSVELEVRRTNCWRPRLTLSPTSPDASVSTFVATRATRFTRRISGFTVPFCDQLTELVTRLEERSDSIRALTSAPGVGGELLLAFSSGNRQGGFTLPVELLARIAALGLDLSLDLYPPTDAT